MCTVVDCNTRDLKRGQDHFSHNLWAWSCDLGGITSIAPCVINSAVVLSRRNHHCLAEPFVPLCSKEDVGHVQQLYERAVLEFLVSFESPLLPIPEKSMCPRWRYFVQCLQGFPLGTQAPFSQFRFRINVATVVLFRVSAYSSMAAKFKQNQAELTAVLPCLCSPSLCGLST